MDRKITRYEKMEQRVAIANHEGIGAGEIGRSLVRISDTEIQYGNAHYTMGLDSNKHWVIVERVVS